MSTGLADKKEESLTKYRQPTQDGDSDSDSDSQSSDHTDDTHEDNELQDEKREDNQPQASSHTDDTHADNKSQTSKDTDDNHQDSGSSDDQNSDSGDGSDDGSDSSGATSSEEEDEEEVIVPRVVAMRDASGKKCPAYQDPDDKSAGQCANYPISGRKYCDYHNSAFQQYGEEADSDSNGSDGDYEDDGEADHNPDGN